MSFRGGGGSQGGRGRGRPKNRASPYGIGKDGKGPSWRDRRGREEGPEQGDFPIQPPNSNMDLAAAGGAEGPQIPGGELNRPPPPPKKFTNKARLFFGNLPRDFTEEELKSILTAHGEVQEVYHNKEKNFAFARMVRAIFRNGS